MPTVVSLLSIWVPVQRWYASISGANQKAASSKARRCEVPSRPLASLFPRLVFMTFLAIIAALSRYILVHSHEGRMMVSHDFLGSRWSTILKCFSNCFETDLVSSTCRRVDPLFPHNFERSHFFITTLLRAF